MEFKDVNENAISCIVDENDLIQWDITLEDLFSNGEKARVFIEDIVQKAQDEYDFVMDNVPLAVQISAMGDEKFIFTISKIGSENSVFSDPGALGKILRDAVAKRISEETSKKKKKHEKPEKDGKKKAGRDKNGKDKKNLVLYFDEFSHAVDFSKRIPDTKGIDSSLLKDDKGTFCMIVRNSKASQEDMDRIIWISGDFAKKIDKKLLTYEYILEHYKMLVKKDAVSVLARI